MSLTRGNDKGYVVAVDLGGTSLACAILDRGCRIVRKILASSHAGLSSDRINANLLENIAAVIGLSGLDPSALAGLGVGTPGIVHPDTGVVHRAANFPHWRDVPLAAILQERFSLPVCVRHDVDMAVVAEREYGAGRGREHVVCLTLGTGIGIGMILNGQLYRGARSGAGNLGHMIVAAEVRGLGHADGAYLENLAAGPAIRRKAVQAVRQGEPTWLREACQGDLERIDARLVFAAARGGDAVGSRIVHETAHLLGAGIANVINLLSPEIVIVSGSIALAGEILFDPLLASVRAHLCPFLRDEVEVVPAQLGDDAGLIGAAHTVWHLAGP